MKNFGNRQDSEKMPSFSKETVPPLKKLQNLISESQNIRGGRLSNTKRHIAYKMKLSESQIKAMWKRDGVKNREPLDFSGASNEER